MRIGIDIDGVMTNDDEFILGCAGKFCFEHGLPGPIDRERYEYEKFDWDEPTMDAYRQAYFYDHLDNGPLRPFAAEVIRRLKEDGHEIYIVTGRYKTYEDSPAGEDIRRRTRAWLDKNGVVYDRLIFAHVPKLRELRDNHIDLMIEDCPDTIRQICEITPVFCYDARYNREFTCPGVTRVYSWYDIYGKIRALADGGKDGKSDE